MTIPHFTLLPLKNLCYLVFTKSPDMKAVLSLLLLCSAVAFGQRRVDVDAGSHQTMNTFFQTVNGTPVLTNVYYRVVEGSPYFKEDWMKGSAALSREVEYQNLTLKLNLLENTVHFQDTRGNEMISNTPINKITLIDPAAGTQYRFVHSSFIPVMVDLSKHVWLECLAEGRAQLYVHYKKSITESRPYGSATLEQRIYTVPQYYLVVNNRLTRIKKVQDVVDALPDKKKELQEWLRNNDIEKNQQGLTRLVEHYNKLTN
jgi:hypothetical protein